MSIGGFSPMMPSASQDVKAHERKVDSNERNAQAQGVGGNDKESEAASEDRDADGRQAWRWTQHQRKPEDEAEQGAPDPTGQTGSTLDLSG